MVKYTHFAFTPWALLWGLVAVVFVYTLHFLFLWLRGHRRPHIKAILHFHYHLIIGLIVTLFFGVFVGVTVYKGLGVQYQAALQVRPDARLIKAGGVATYSYSLARYLPPVVLDQGNTNSCLAFAMTEARYMDDVLRGENPPDVFSGFYTYWWVTGGANVETSIEQEAQSIQNHGVTLLGNQPYFGAPNQAAVNAAVEYGGNYHYIFYNFYGQDSIDAIKAEISSGHPVVLLIAVNSDFQNAFNGNSYTNNYGGFVGYHAVVAYAYDGNNFWVRNSWGAGFGIGGNIELTSIAIFNSAIGAVVLDPSPQVAYYTPPPPIPTITPRPTPRPTPTATPRPSFLVKVKTHLRSKPLLGAVTKYGLRKGWKLIDLKKQTTSWRYTRTLSGHRGWALKDDLCPVRGCPRPKSTPRPKPRPRIAAVHFLVTRATHFRLKPVLDYAIDRSLLRKGYKLVYLNRKTPHWLYARTLDRKHKGWILKVNVRIIK